MHGAEGNVAIDDAFVLPSLVSPQSPMSAQILGPSYGEIDVSSFSPFDEYST
jgi:hypothetical protein